ncbi:phospholipid/cholesterol/gamma-HCH transport system substrate-binding protein [Actinokineospora alba]|uniref:Phospholipid/cholesterol/gamma-HCH transport system substrate-binding protein n=1 Tax=Actinokineospora alba TaxID=504798 RepID=A0A1H0UIY3_9PSEU|nr:MCE family protein [Actinokineospora alba]TDP65054.1 phospholipid/cholesterol/gamma-HCH transport system substrate-binding protein [Actinokineospora alba]SDH52888.1 phospholipid/cholesterol/gamma-HCH transport system substrate-binding protein [Actinokineospora alba]SDP66053.1 phospholipid/cholesterol/gamma-HCH transport system substrate-binding protein [Actinokineospora alba]
MKSLRERNQAGVGAVTLVLVVLVVLATFFSDDLPIIGGGTTYSAEFTESAGLRPGNEVRVAGVKVGAVDAVALAGNKVRVDFTVRDARVGDRSTLSIQIRTLLGDKFLAIAADGSRPQDPNEVIPKTRTLTPFDIVPVFDQLTKTVQKIDTDQLAESFRVVSEAMSGSPAHLRDALTGMSRLSATLSTRDEELARLLSNTSSLSKTVADRDKQLQKLFADAGLLLEELQLRRSAVSKLLSGTKALADELHGLVADNTAQLKPMLTQLDKVTTVLARNQDNLSKGVAALAPFVRVFNNTVGNGRWFEGYICGLFPPSSKTALIDINPEGCYTPLTPGGGK